MIPGVTCETCAFFSPAPSYAKNQATGQCRRLSPQLSEDERGLRTSWPLVSETQWCGEHAVAVEL